jgi:hypothetical protein
MHFDVFRMPRDMSDGPDTRYTFQRTEQDGTPWFVVSFGAEYIGKSLDGETASRIAQYHADTDTSVRSPIVATDYPVRPLPPEQVLSPMAGMDVVTCGACHRSWDDAVSTSMTPAPSARYHHEDEEHTASPVEGPEGVFDVEGHPRFSMVEGANAPMMTLGQFRAATAYLDASTLIVVETGSNQERHVPNMGLPSPDPDSDESGFSAITLFMGVALDYRDF